jgi:hypothetical protein
MAVDGTYNVLVKAPIGKTEMILNFKSDGSILTGTVQSKNEETPLCEGVVQGDEFSFEFEMKAPMGKQKVSVKGSVEGDEICGFVTTPLGTVSMNGQRA